MIQLKYILHKIVSKLKKLPFYSILRKVQNSQFSFFFFKYKDDWLSVKYNDLQLPAKTHQPTPASSSVTNTNTTTKKNSMYERAVGIGPFYNYECLLLTRVIMYFPFSRSQIVFN